MDTYSVMRQFADSWVLLAMTLFFLGVVVWAFRPGSRPAHDDSAAIPFRNEDGPRTDRSGDTDCDPDSTTRDGTDGSATTTGADR